MTSGEIQQYQSSGDAADGDPTDNVMRVASDSADPNEGQLYWRGHRFTCVLGKGGIIAATRKVEGDNATPAGLFGLDVLYYRADRMDMPDTKLPVQAITERLGWCDAPEAEAYNEPIALPADDSAEMMWRNDHVYDLVISLRHNRRPARPGKGSAIFMHIARDDLSPTRGCVALAKDDLLALLSEIGPETMIRIYAGSSDSV